MAPEVDVSLSNEHELQVHAYLRFAKLKRDQHVRETLSVIRDFKQDRVVAGEMYNAQELGTLFKELEAEVHRLVDKEIQHAYHTNALLIKMLLSQAQERGVELQVDTGALEDEILLRGVAGSEAAALARPASDFTCRAGTLSKLGSVATVVVPDAGMAMERQRLEQEVKALQERLIRFQEQTTAVMRERSAATNQAATLQEELGARDQTLHGLQLGSAALLSKLQGDFQALSTEASTAAATSKTQLTELQRQLEGQRAALEEARVSLAEAQRQLALKEAEAREARDALDGRLQEAPQFKQMRAIMQAKGTEVAELRKRLNKYEPQDVPSAD